MIRQGWFIVNERPDVHVVPLNDWEPHQVGRACWCHPTTEDDEGLVVVHNALDGRESYEDGRPLS